VYISYVDHGFSSAKLLLKFASTLDYLKICKFITYWTLEAVNVKKSLIITGTTNWNWIKFGLGFLQSFFNGFYPKNGVFWILPMDVSEPCQCSLRTFCRWLMGLRCGLSFQGSIDCCTAIAKSEPASYHCTNHKWHIHNCQHTAFKRFQTL